MLIILLSFLVVDIALLFITLLPVFKPVYMFIFEHKDWALWKKIIDNLENAKVIRYNDYDARRPELSNFEFSLEIDGKECIIKFWKKYDTIGVFEEDTNKCMLSDFDQYHAGIAKRKLMEMLQNNGEV